MNTLTRSLALAAFGCACAAATVSAQSANPLTDASKAQWTQIKTLVVKAAEQMPEADYTFRPVATVRTFGELVAHIADDNYGICAFAVGDANQKVGDAEKTKKTGKAEVVAILKASVAYCDAAFAKMTDKTGAEVGSFFGSKMPRLSMLVANTGHNQEHYGNIVTYLRVKGLVPPSSQQSQ